MVCETLLDQTTLVALLPASETRRKRLNEKALARNCPHFADWPDDDHPTQKILFAGTKDLTPEQPQKPRPHASQWCRVPILSIFLFQLPGKGQKCPERSTMRI